MWRGLVQPVSVYAHINNASAISHVIDGVPSPPPAPVFQPPPPPLPIMASEPRTGMLAAEQHPVGRKLDNAFVTPRIVCHWREFTLGLDLPSRVRCFPSLPGPANTVYPNFPPKIVPSPAFTLDFYPPPPLFRHDINKLNEKIPPLYVEYLFVPSIDRRNGCEKCVRKECQKVRSGLISLNSNNKNTTDPLLERGGYNFPLPCLLANDRSISRITFDLRNFQRRIRGIFRSIQVISSPPSRLERYRSCTHGGKYG